MEDGFGLDGLELRLDPIWIVLLVETLIADALDIRRVLFHVDAHGAGEGFRQDERDQRGGGDDQQEDRNYHRLAYPDDPPVIQEMEFDFRSVKTFCFCLGYFHKSKKEAGRAAPASPSNPIQTVSNWREHPRNIGRA